MYRTDGKRAFFYRAVSSDEYRSWKEFDRLLPAPGGMEMGKHLTISSALARRWAGSFIERGWETGPFHILMVEIDDFVAQKIDYLGPNVDNIGHAYFAMFEQLKGAEITEVSDGN